MIAISDIIKQIDQYTDGAGHPPPRIAVTPDQMVTILDDQNAKRFISRDSDGLTIIAGVVIDTWGKPMRDGERTTWR